MSGQKAKILKQNKNNLQDNQKTLANENDSVKMQGESVLMDLRRNALSQVAKLNQLLGIDCCDHCGKKTA